LTLPVADLYNARPDCLTRVHPRAGVFVPDYRAIRVSEFNFLKKREISGSFPVRTGAVLRLQGVLVCLAAVVFLILSGPFQAGSALYGGIIALLAALLLEWRRTRTGRGRALNADQSIRALYRSAVERMGLVVVLFVLGMGVLRLDPLALLTGFIAGQTGLLITGRKN
jgi:ATP synthase protein I